MGRLICSVYGIVYIQQTESESESVIVLFQKNVVNKTNLRFKSNEKISYANYGNISEQSARKKC